MTIFGKKRSIFWLATLASLCIFSAANAFSFFWNKDQNPSKALISFSLQEPQISFRDQEKDQNLTLTFKNAGSPVSLRSEAKQEIAKYIKISPHIAGKWIWKQDHVLDLKIDDEIRSNTEYVVKISSKFFSEKVELTDNQESFVSPSFSCSLAEKEFYINPEDSADTKVAAKLECNYPLQEKNIEDYVRLQISQRQIPLNFSFSKYKKHLKIVSDKIELSEQELYADLSVLEGLKNIYTSHLGNQQDYQIKIPSIETIFQIKNISTQIVRKNDALNTPVQVLNVEATLPFKEDDLQDGLEVYLLPKTRGYWNDDNLKPDIIARSAKLELTKIPSASESEFSSSASFEYSVQDLNQSRQILVKTEAGLQTQGGYKTKRPFQRILNVPNYPKEVKILGEGALLNLKGDKKLSYSNLGNKTVRIQVKRLLPKQVNHLITQTNGQPKNIHFKNYNFSEDNFTELFETKQQFPTIDQQGVSYSHIDLGSYIKDRQGIFFLEIDNAVRYGAVRDKRFVMVTDIGLLLKRDVKNNLTVFVSSISSQAPLIGAKVEIIGKNGIAIASKISDRDGVVRFPDLRHHQNEKQPIAVLVTYGEDLTFLAYELRQNLNYSSFKVEGERIRHQGRKDLDAYLFTDRDLYRPGEKVSLVSIIKRHDFTPVGEIPLEIEILNPANKLVHKQALKLPTGGVFDLIFPTEYTDPTGIYRSYVYLLNSRNGYQHRELLGSKEFSLAEFQPDKIKVSTKFSGLEEKDFGWSKLENLQAEVTAMHMYGMPVTDSLVRANLKITPTWFYSNKFKDYKFTNLLEEEDKNEKIKNEIDLKEEKTNKDGVASFAIDLSAYAKGFYKATFEAEAFAEENGKSVKSQRSILLSSYEHLVGFKADGRLSFVNSNSRRIIDFIAIDEQQKQISLSGLTIEIYKEKYVSSLVKDNRGLYNYQSISKKEKYKSEAFNLAETGSSYTLPTQDAGKYILFLKDQAGEVLTKIEYKIVGANNTSFALEHNSNLEISLSKDAYKNGETISLNINSPYSGYGLITIEKDKVYNYKWFKADKTSTVQSITIPEGIEGNAYVNVVLVRSLTDKEIYTSPLSYAVTPFKIDLGNRSIEIDLDVPDIIKPNEEVTIKYNLSRPGKLVIFGVDQGILQLAGYQVPDPLAFFFRKQALEVETAQILDLLIPEYNIIQSLSAPGGGMHKMAAFAEMADKQLNPFKRRDLEPAIMWSGILDAKEKQGEFSFKMPAYFNGGLKLMAVAVNDFALGSTSKDILVRSPIIINPSVPTNVTPGDKFKVSVNLTNNIRVGDADSDVISLTLETTEGIEILGEKSYEITLKKGETSKLLIDATAHDKLGANEIKIQAKTKDAKEVSSYDLTLSVRPENAYTTDIISGMSANSKINIDLTNSLYPDLASNKFSLASNPLIFAKNLGNFLAKYPYGCSEQISSKLFAYVNLSKFAPLLMEVDKAHEFFQEGINKLRARQNADGSINLWSNQNFHDRFVTIYVAHLLTDASQQHFPMFGDFKEDLLKWLETFVGKNPDSLSEARLQSYAAYILTRNGKVITPRLIAILDYLKKNHPTYKQDIAAVYLAATYSLLRDNNNARDLVREYAFPHANLTQSYFYYESSYAYDAQYLYLIAKHFPDRAKQIEISKIQDFLRPITEKNYNTLSASYVIMALANFSDKTIDELKFDFTVSGKNDEEIKVDSSNPYQITLPNDATKVTIRNPNKELLFYASTSSGFPRKNLEVQSKDLQISKNYFAANGEPIASVELGDEITVKVKVKLFKDIGINSAVIVDLLPGGFEIVPDSLQLDRANFQEAREDRYIIYTSLSKDKEYEFSYKLKAINLGEYNIPASFVSDMYDQNMNARSKLGDKLIIK